MFFFRWIWRTLCNFAGIYFADERRLVVTKVSHWSSRTGTGSWMRSSEDVSMQGYSPDDDQVMIRMVVDDGMVVQRGEASFHSADGPQHNLIAGVGQSFAVLGTTTRGFACELIPDGVKFTVERFLGKLIVSAVQLTTREAMELSDGAVRSVNLE